jgi:uncharacterized integral membrane protein
MKFKFVVSLVLAFLTIIFISQNSETVRVVFLAWSVEMSLILLLFIILGAGVILGCLLPGFIRFVSQRKQVKSRENAPVPGKTPHAEANAGEEKKQAKDLAP